MKKRLFVCMLFFVMIFGVSYITEANENTEENTEANIKPGMYTVDRGDGSDISMVVVFDENGMTQISITDISYLNDYFGLGGCFNSIRSELIDKALETQTYANLADGYTEGSSEYLCARMFSSALSICMDKAGMVVEPPAKKPSIRTSEDGDWTIERMVVLSYNLLYNSVKDPYSLEINKITIGYREAEESEDIEVIKIIYHAANSFGNSVIGIAQTEVWDSNVEPSFAPHIYDETIPNGRALVLFTEDEDIPLKDEREISFQINK